MRFNGWTQDQTDATEQAGSYQIEIVDHAHPQWGAVLAAVEFAGQRHVLSVGPGGWMSARQAVAAAFRGEEVVGYAVFHVEPTRSVANSMCLQPSGVVMHAVFDAVTTCHADVDIAGMLVLVAKSHAERTLGCVGFDRPRLAA